MLLSCASSALILLARMTAAMMDWLWGDAYRAERWKNLASKYMSCESYQSPQAMTWTWYEIWSQMKKHIIPIPPWPGNPHSPSDRNWKSAFVACKTCAHVDVDVLARTKHVDNHSDQTFKHTPQSDTADINLAHGGCWHTEPRDSPVRCFHSEAHASPILENIGKFWWLYAACWLCERPQVCVRGSLH